MSPVHQSLPESSNMGIAQTVHGQSVPQVREEEEPDNDDQQTDLVPPMPQLLCCPTRSRLTALSPTTSTSIRSVSATSSTPGSTSPEVQKEVQQTDKARRSNIGTQVVTPPWQLEATPLKDMLLHQLKAKPQGYMSAGDYIIVYNKEKKQYVRVQLLHHAGGKSCHKSSLHWTWRHKDGSEDQGLLLQGDCWGMPPEDTDFHTPLCQFCMVIASVPQESLSLEISPNKDEVEVQWLPMEMRQKPLNIAFAETVDLRVRG